MDEDPLDFDSLDNDAQSFLRTFSESEMQLAEEKAGENSQFTVKQLLNYAGIVISTQSYRLKTTKKQSPWNLFLAEAKADVPIQLQQPKKVESAGKLQFDGKYTKHLSMQYKERKEEYTEKARQINELGLKQLVGPSATLQKKLLKQLRELVISVSQ